MGAVYVVTSVQPLPAEAPMPQPIKVAIIQSAPVYYNLQASLAKAVDLIRQAARSGARLVVLGET